MNEETNRLMILQRLSRSFGPQLGDSDPENDWNLEIEDDSEDDDDDDDDDDDELDDDADGDQTQVIN